MLPKPPSPPPLSAEFHSTIQPSLPGGGAKQQGWSLFRSSDGKTRVDQGDHSLITDPVAGQAIHLDHTNKVAQIFPMPAPPAKPAVPSGGAPSVTPPNTSLSVTDLGKRMIAGHEVEGKSYTYPAPKPPGAPASPTAPGSSPSAPSQPQMPKPPAMPGPQTMEVWTSPKLQLPLASRVTGVMGKQTTIGKQITPGEPPASQFQIPQGYKLVQPR